MLYRLAFICTVVVGGLAAAPRTGRAEPHLEVSAQKPRPGDPILVTVTGVDRMPRGAGGKVPLIFFPVAAGWQAVFAVPLDDNQAELKVVLSQPRLSQTLAIEPRKWDEEQVKIADPEMAEPPADKRKIINKDNATIIAAIRDPGPPRFAAGFGRPGNGEKTSTFGAWRTLNGGYRSRHLGLDFGVRKGTDVKAIQDGKVGAVTSGFLTGGTVVITHGAGIASTYFHLDDIKVAVGDTVERGVVIGKVGMTGRTTGPHIHIGIWVPGGFIDPDAFFKLKIGPPVEPARK